MKHKLILFVIFGLTIFLTGIVVGMLLGTYTVIDHVIQGLSGSTFIINFNETRMMQEFNRTIMPEIIKNLRINNGSN